MERYLDESDDTSKEIRREERRQYNNLAYQTRENTGKASLHPNPENRQIVAASAAVASGTSTCTGTGRALPIVRPKRGKKAMKMEERHRLRIYLPEPAFQNGGKDGKRQN